MKRKRTKATDRQVADQEMLRAVSQLKRWSARKTPVALRIAGGPFLDLAFYGHISQGPAPFEGFVFTAFQDALQAVLSPVAFILGNVSVKQENDNTVITVRRDTWRMAVMAVNTLADRVASIQLANKYIH